MTAPHSSNDGPRLVAHRGYPARYPENTLEGLRAAIAAGAEYVEFDVQLTRDQVPVLLHDETLLRTAGIDRSVFDLNAAEVSRIDVSERDRLGAANAGMVMPLLEQIVGDLAGRGHVTAFVELKRHSIARFGAVATVKRVLDSLEPILDDCIIISFVHSSLMETRRRADVPIGWVLRNWDDATRKAAEDLLPEYLFVKDTLLPVDAVPWQGAWDWVCYDITDYEYALRLHHRGVDMISTFDIGKLLAAARRPRPTG